MNKFSATIEFLIDQKAAIIELTNDENGEFAGAGRIELPRNHGDVRSDLYEAGYSRAAMAAAFHGGRLERFSEFGS